MGIALQISSAKLSDDRLQALAVNLCEKINKETNIAAEIAEGHFQEGAKGEPITLGLIILTFLAGGSAVALLDVLKSYIDKDRSIEIGILEPNGIES